MTMIIVSPVRSICSVKFVHVLLDLASLLEL